MDKFEFRIRTMELSRKDELLNICLDVFVEKGYESSTVNDLIQAGEISKGGFYHYFKSKDEVLDELRESYTSWFLERIDEEISAFKDKPAKALRCWIYTYLELYFHSFEVHDLVYHTVHSLRSSNDRILMINQLREILLKGQELKLWEGVDTSFVASLMYHSLHGVADEAILDHIEIIKDLADSSYNYLIKFLN